MELWEKKVTKEFGATAENYAAYQRVKDNLRTLAALANVLQCMTQRPPIPLHGHDSAAAEATGIAECRLSLQ